MTQESPPRVFLIDGYALIYRAFFAMIARPLRTSRGENTSAVWGVANFLHRLVADHDPTYVAWVHDAGSSFRDEVFPDYKATREKLDDELQEDFDRSLERIEQLLAGFGVPLVVVDGYEADDVIGTLATQAANRSMQAVIVSGDKDFYQLIAPHVSLLNPGRGGPAAVDSQWVDASNARERFGVAPDQVVDYLALVGDSSDNIPGVKGVGDKTARKLLETYGDLDTILAHASDVTGKRAREALLADADNARLSRELVTIRRNVPVRATIEDLCRAPMDVNRLETLYTELEFHTLIPNVRRDPGGRAPVARDHEIVDSPEALAVMLRELRKVDAVALRVETSAADPLRANLVGLSLAIAGDRAWYLPLGHRLPDGELTAAAAPRNLPSIGEPVMQALVGVLEDPHYAKIGHDLKRDALVLRRAGVSLRGLRYDAMLASFVLEPGRRSHALEVLALDHLGRRLTAAEDLVGKGKGERPFAEVPPDRAAAHSCGGAVAIWELQAFFAPQLKSHDLTALLGDMEMPLIDVLIDMEWRGIAVDTSCLALLSREFGGELRELEAKIHREAGTDFNINSTPQLRHVLFEKLNLPVLKRTKTGASTDADVLSELAASGHTLPQLLLDYREVSKLRSTYLDALPLTVHPDTARIHTSFSQVGAATGRLSSSSPNLQNIPVRTPRGERIRRCFVPAAGAVFVIADYSQVELRLLAHLSRDPVFLAAFQRGGDIHRETAAVIFDVSLDEVTAEMRARAKTINFATIYGQGPFSLSRQLGISQDEAREFIDLYFERFAGVRRFLDECIVLARQRGYAETLFGRRRYIPELKDRNYNMRAFGERVAMNSPLQGSAADLIKRAMISVAGSLRERRLSAAIVLQVHDELVAEAPEREVEAVREVLREEMQGAAELSIPLVVEIGVGPNWLEAKG
jgi:DNA polymerase-1